MRWLPILLAIACCGILSERLFADAVDQANPTIASRLASAKYCAIERTDGLLDVILRVYTAEQHELYADSMSKYRTEREARTKTRDVLRKQLQGIYDSASSRDEAETQTRDLLSSQGPTPPRWLLRSTLCRVISIGQDFVEIEEVDTPDGTTLIPFSKLGKIVFMKSIVAGD